ncbi:MAG: ATP synthase F1 subunit delta [Malacoplasma sp.]
MNTDNLINSYSLAILEIYHDNKNVFDDFMLLDNIFENNSELLSILSSNNLTKQEKIEIVDNVFVNDLYLFDVLVINFLKVLIENKYFIHFSKILKRFKNEVNRENNIVYVEIHTAFEIDQKNLNEILNFLIEKLNAKIDYKILIDKSLIGGFKILYGSTVIDFSIKSKIDHIKYATKEKSFL